MNKKLIDKRNKPLANTVLTIALECLLISMVCLQISFAETAEPELMLPVQDVHFQELPPPGLLESVSALDGVPVTRQAEVKQAPEQQAKKAPVKSAVGVKKHPEKKVAKQLHSQQMRQKNRFVPKAGGSEKSPPPATTPLQTLMLNAQRGNAQAQYELGLRYQYGNGVPKAPSKAHRWLNKAAQANHARAQYALSLFYQQYARNRPGLKKALLWMKKAADQGLADAQYSLGMMFKNGTLVYANPAESRKWLQKAAAQGYELAQLALQ